MHQYLDFGNGVLIPLYNLFIGIGAILGYLHLEKELKDRRVHFDIDRNIYIALIFSLVVGLLGAKLLNMLYHGYEFTFSNFLGSGSTFMGGLLSAGAIYFIANKILGTKLSLAFNLLVPVILVSHFFGRIGCFFAGCCFGKPTEIVFGVVYPEISLPSQVYDFGVHLHPVQLYEAFFLISLFIVIKKYIRFELRLFYYFTLYGIGRFILEYFRGDNRGEIITAMISPSQIVSLIFILIGSFYYQKVTKKK